jgi:hypothetical protein
MQPNLIPVELEDGVVIHIQAEDSGIPTRNLSPTKQSVKRSFEAIKTLVYGYTVHTIGAFKNLGSGNVTEVKLDFGIGISAQTGVPYIASGTTNCNVKISVKCEFPSSSEQ